MITTIMNYNIHITTIGGNEYVGEFVRIDFAKWGRKRKRELTLVFKEYGDITSAIPMRDVKTVIPYDKNECQNCEKLNCEDRGICVCPNKVGSSEKDCTR